MKIDVQFINALPGPHNSIGGWQKQKDLSQSQQLRVRT